MKYVQGRQTGITTPPPPPPPLEWPTSLAAEESVSGLKTFSPDDLQTSRTEIMLSHYSRLREAVLGETLVVCERLRVCSSDYRNAQGKAAGARPQTHVQRPPA